mmetsp:Transcript_36417/g.55906  ORF Transcript_36417/g.55906 Transcript_36417/m.55906 type:complete len:230 (-) Transcript_36417:735-1424(-)
MLFTLVLEENTKDVIQICLHLFLLFLLSVLNRLPEIDAQVLGSALEGVRLVEQLDAFLSTGDVVVQHVVVRVVGLGSVGEGTRLLLSDGGNVSSLGEHLFEVLHGHFARHEAHEDVRLESGLLEAGNGLVELLSVVDVVLLARDMGVDEHSLSVEVLLHVDTLNGGLGAKMRFERDEAGSGGLLVQLDGVDVAELLEEVLKVSLGVRGGQILDVQVSVFALGFTTLILL